MVLVWDAVQRRGFQLYLGQAIYTVWEQPSMPEAHTHPAEYAKAYFEQVERAGPSYRQGKTVTTVVGRRVVEGLDVMVTRNAVDDGRQFEEWYSPALEEILRRQAEIPAQGIKTQMKLERVTVGEPDAALFAIPAGYKQVRMEKGHVVWTEP